MRLKKKLEEYKIILYGLLYEGHQSQSWVSTGQSRIIKCSRCIVLFFHYAYHATLKSRIVIRAVT